MKDLLFWAISTIAVLVFGLISFMMLGEWWNVKVLGQTSGYPWGAINENPWFYANPNLYSAVMLVEGFLLLLALIVLIIKIIKSKKTEVLYALMICSGLVLLFLISASIK